MSRIPHHPYPPRARRAAWRALRCALLCPLLAWAPAALAQAPAAGAPASLKQEGWPGIMKNSPFPF